jgi:subtilase family serine protease
MAGARENRTGWRSIMLAILFCTATATANAEPHVMLILPASLPPKAGPAAKPGSASQVASATEPAPAATTTGAGPAAKSSTGAHALLSRQLPDLVASGEAKPAGAPDPSTRLVLAISLPQRNQAALDALLRDIYNPHSPNYRHYLSVQEFTDRFGPSASDYDTATKFFADSGLTILATAPNRYLVTVAGAVADIERVFHVKIGLYKHPTEARNFFSADREPTVDLAVPLQHITGLDNFVIPYDRLLRAPANAPARNAGGSAPGGNFDGFDVRTAYAANSFLTGAGQSVGLMELQGYELYDVQTYFSWLNQPLNVPIVGISVDGIKLGCRNTCDDSEQSLDIEYAISMAPGLAQLQVYVGYLPEDVLNRQASDNTSAVLSTSWGWAEKEIATDDPIFKEMAAQGQTNLTASGDYSSLKASGPWPEESVVITAVGGTDLYTESPGGPWSGERGWNGSAGGPALHKLFPIPSYQLPFINAANGGSKKWRDVPDIAGDADLDNFICADGGCFGGYGGTSFASPIWAGYIALANEQSARHHKGRIGFLNPALYALGGNPLYLSYFHDETRGKSGLYSCVPSYDLVTGLGSPTPNLIDALALGPAE